PGVSSARFSVGTMSSGRPIVSPLAPKASANRTTSTGPRSTPDARPYLATSWKRTMSYAPSIHTRWTRLHPRRTVASATVRGPYEADAISPERRGEHVDDIVVILDHEQSATGQFRKIATVHGQLGSSSRRAEPAAPIGH